MTIAQRQNVTAQALPEFVALMRDTQMPEVSSEQALAEATKTLFRAWFSYSALDSEDTAEPQVLATAWLNLWRAQANHAQLVSQFEWPPAEVGTARAFAETGGVVAQT